MTIPDLPTPPEFSGQTKAGVKFHILGTIQQTLIAELQPNQVVFSDTGAMSWMTAAISMNTKASGGLGGMFKRAVSGASAFIIDFAAQGGAGQVAFSTDFPGKILPVELEPGRSVIMHRHAFLCAPRGIPDAGRREPPIEPARARCYLQGARPARCGSPCRSELAARRSRSIPTFPCTRSRGPAGGPSIPVAGPCWRG